MGDDFDQSDSSLNDLPQALREDLASLYTPPAGVPAKVSDAILNRAHAKIAGMHREPRSRILRYAGAAVAAAACVVLVGRVVLRGPLSPDDIDGNRRVDIVDALKLAHQIQSGKGRDLNGDGRIDQRDVDVIAVAVVKLDATEGSVQ